MGFEVKIDLSWIFIAILIVWSLAQGLFPFFYSGLSTTAYWLMGFGGCLGLLFSIIFYEVSLPGGPAAPHADKGDYLVYLRRCGGDAGGADQGRVAAAYSERAGPTLRGGHDCRCGDEDAAEALSKMNGNGSTWLMVTKADRLIGILSLKDLLKLFSLKMELETSDTR